MSRPLPRALNAERSVVRIIFWLHSSRRDRVVVGVVDGDGAGPKELGLGLGGTNRDAGILASERSQSDQRSGVV